MKVRILPAVPSLAVACLVLFGCGSTSMHVRYDEQYVRAVTRPALACDNAERCARGMESDLLTDSSLSEVDRSAVKATIQSLCVAVRSEPEALLDPAKRELESIQFAEMVDARVDTALALWSDINQRYGRMKSE